MSVTERSDNSAESIKTMAMVTYGCFAAGLFFAFIPTVVGLIIAYVKRGEAGGTVYESHFTWLIRTFWIGLIVGFIGGITSFILIGIPILIAAGIWTIYRIVVGFLRVIDGKPIANPTGYF